MAWTDKQRQIVERELELNPGLVPGRLMSYDAWLDRTGLDDSFVGLFDRGGNVPGTADLYEGAMEAVERKKEISAARQPRV